MKINFWKKLKKFANKTDENTGSENIKVQSASRQNRQNASADKIKQEPFKQADTPLPEPERLVTEVRSVRIAYGFAKVEESSDGKILHTTGLPKNCNMAPYHDKGIILGVYLLDLQNEIADTEYEASYPIIESIPYFLIEDEDRKVIIKQLSDNSVTLREPVEHDITDTITSRLNESQVTWRNEAAGDFNLDKFVKEISQVKSSNQFNGVYLIKTVKRRRFVMAVNQLIESVIDLNPKFIKIYQPEAVRISFGDNQDTWLAPIKSGIIHQTA